jgi:hypothetical protein
MIISLRFSVLILLFSASYSVLAQEKVKKVARPDIPGIFIVDLGLTRGSHITPNWDQGLWGSRTLNVYYQYPLRIRKSKFSFNPGAGFGFDRYKMRNEYTFQSTPDPDGSFSLVPANQVFAGSTIHKSQIIADYFDFPFDFRYDTRPDDRSRSFNVTLGGRFGYLYNAMTKVKYSDNGQSIANKDKQDHGLNPIRYGVYGRIGGGGFNFFCFYNLSPLFASGKGPAQTQMTSVTIGISLSGL